MKNKPNFFIAKEVQVKFPDLGEVLLPVYGVRVEQDETIVTTELFEEQLGKIGKEDFFGQQEFAAFREFCQKAGFDIKAKPPSVENLFRRYLENGTVPQVNNIVDISNKVALETRVPVGVFDLAAVKGDLLLRYSKEGEEFRPLSGGVEYLPAGRMVIVDEEKILNLFPYVDSVYPKIAKSTKDVLILADVVEGITRKQAEEAAEKIAELLEEKAGGERAKVYFSEAKSDEVRVMSSDGEKQVSEKKRVFSGSRPTGRLHLGNYLGGIKGYIALQEREDLDCIYSVVDIHGIFSPYDPETFQASIRNIVLDYLGAGLDPKKCHLMVQSQVSEHMELAFLFASIYPVSRMEQLPTYKSKKKEQPEYINVGLFTYPILQAADILVYKAGLVPVGIDQEPHIELTREVARKFNSMFKTMFPEPQRYASRVDTVMGLTGEGKMSKSVEGSYILLTDDLETIRQRLAKVPTDTGKGEKVPQEGGVATLLQLAGLFMGDKVRKVYEKKYLGEGIRYSEMKAELAEAIYEDLKPIQERRAYFESHPEEVDRILEEGREYCSKIARATLQEAKAAMGLV